jgi:hypothetical protein
MAKVVADRLVAHGLDRRLVPTRDDHHRRVGDVAEGLISGHGERSVGAHGLDPLGDHHRAVLVAKAPQASEDLQRADQVKERQARVQHERDRL